jgi:hypothetical protein
MVGILRIGHALARGGDADVTSIDVDASANQLLVRVEGGNPAHAVADAEEQAPVLARALGSKVRFSFATAGRSTTP